jgi:hypothetical protein
MFGIPVQIRINCDTVWLFAGMTDKLMFSMIIVRSVSTEETGGKLIMI